MDSRNRQRLKRMVNHKTRLSQRALASTFGCSQAYICKVIKKLKIAYRRRMKVPKYKDPAAMREARKRGAGSCTGSFGSSISSSMTKSISAYLASRCQGTGVTTPQTSPSPHFRKEYGCNCTVVRRQLLGATPAPLPQQPLPSRRLRLLARQSQRPLHTGDHQIS